MGKASVRIKGRPNLWLSSSRVDLCEGPALVHQLLPHRSSWDLMHRGEVLIQACHSLLAPSHRALSVDVARTTLHAGRPGWWFFPVNLPPVARQVHDDCLALGAPAKRSHPHWGLLAHSGPGCVVAGLLLLGGLRSLDFRLGLAS